MKKGRKNYLEIFYERYNMSKDNQEIIDNANESYERGEISREQRNGAVRLAIANEAEQDLLNDLESR